AAAARRVRGAPVAQGFPARRPGRAGLAGCARTGRAGDIGSFPQAAGTTGRTGRLATGMTAQGAERSDGPAPGPPAPGVPGPGSPDQGPLEPSAAGPRDPGPAIPDQGPLEPGAAGPRDPGPATSGPPALDLDAGHLPPRSRGVIGLLEENCTVCMLCARECPDWCIYIESHKQTVPAPDSGRPRVRNVLDRFAIDFSLCMYCGICIEVCPY